MAELGEDGEEVGSVFSAGILPVEVDAVEEPGLIGGAGVDVVAGREVSAEKDVDAGADEGFASGGLGIGGEIRGAAFEGDEELELRVEMLELGELVEVAVKGGRRVVGLAVDGVLGGEGDVGVGVWVGDGAAAVGDEALGVVDLIELVGGSAGDEVLDEEVLIEAPLAEVADDDGAYGWAAFGRLAGAREGEGEAEGGEEHGGGGALEGEGAAVRLGHGCLTALRAWGIQRRGLKRGEGAAY